MYFELTEALIGGILFAMEDQQSHSLVDTRTGRIVRERPAECEEGRFIDIPEWGSSDGFRLMERFTAGFRNPVIQRELTAVLDRGRGVFRAFKDTLNRFPEAEKRWFAFKEREMKQAVIRWYNAWRDEWGMNHIGAEPEETDDLVLEDFTFQRPDPIDIVRAQKMHSRLFKAEAALPEDLRLVAKTGSGELAGYIGVIRNGGGLHIKALAVKPEFRGLGVGEELCSRFLSGLTPQEAAYITVDLPSGAEGFSQVLLRRGFTPFAVRYYKASSPGSGHFQNSGDKYDVKPQAGNQQEP